MKLKTPKVVKKVDLQAYADEMKGETVYFWLNPPMEMIRQHTELSMAAVKAVDNSAKEETADALREWYAVVFSQGPEERHLSKQELNEMEQEDSAFVSWLINRYWAERNAFILSAKKK